MKQYVYLFLATVIFLACQGRPATEKKADLLVLTFSRNIVTTDPEMIKSVYRTGHVDPAAMYFRSLKFPRQLVTITKNLNLTLISVDPGQPAALFSLPAGYDQRMINSIQQSLPWIDNVRVAKGGTNMDLTAFEKVADPNSFWALPAGSPEQKEE